MPTPLALLDLRVSMVDALSDLIADYEVSGHSTRTNVLFKTHIGKLIEFLVPGDDDDPAVIAARNALTLDEITPVHVTRFLAHEQKRGLRPASLNIALRMIRTFFTWCIGHDQFAGPNPATKVSTPRVVLEPVTFLSDEQIDTLLKTTATDKTMEGVRDGALIRVARDTGVRRGELVGMRVEDVSLDERQIVVRAITSKNRKGRVVGIAKDTQSALRAYLRVRAAYIVRLGHDDTGMLWVAGKGDLSGGGALQALHRRLRDAGLPKVTMHSLRHRWTATAFQNGLPLPYIVNLGGWANAVMPTSRYGMFGVQERALSAMQELLDRPVKR
jgi:site-specific recombinase XerD